MNVRRLAAVDMYGLSGAPWRRWVILFEFLIGAFGGVVLAIFMLRVGGVTATVLGVWLLGIAVNYMPLAVYALVFIRPATLRAELDNVDLRGELRRYTRAQFWVFVPMVLLGLDVRQRAVRRQA